MNREPGAARHLGPFMIIPVDPAMECLCKCTLGGHPDKARCGVCGRCAGFMPRLADRLRLLVAVALRYHP